MFYQSARLVKVKDKPNSWRGVLSFKDASGKWRQKSKRLSATTESAAKRQLTAWRATMEAEASETVFPSASIDLSDYIDGYIDRLEAMESVSPTTISSYRNVARRVRRTLGPKRIDRLTRADAEKWEASLLDEFASVTVIKCHRLVKMVLDQAVAEEVIRTNPLNGVKPPKKVAAHQGINALDAKERSRVVSILDPMVPSPMATAALISLFTGLRRGEVCGLKWSDIDLNRGIMWVRRSIGEGDGGNTYIKEPKTGESRDVAIPGRLAEVLKRRKAFQNSGCEWVVGDATFMKPHTLTREWGAIVKNYNIRGVEGRLCTFHDLRHTWATAAVAGGIDIKTVSSNLGHANAAMTLNIYASADPDAKRRAAEKMNEII